MSPTIEATAKGVRSRYAFLFASAAELFSLRYGEKPSTKFEDIKSATAKLREDDYLNDYLWANIQALYEIYPTMMPGMHQDQPRLNQIDQLLSLTIGDLCAEIKEITDSAEEHDTQMLIKQLLG